MSLGCTKHVQVPADHCQHHEELGHVWCFLSSGPLCLTEPHPQNTPAASIPLWDAAKIELPLLLEQFLPSRACAGAGVCASWGSLHQSSPHGAPHASGVSHAGGCSQQYLCSLSAGN